jgi:outer membrane protein assembly factor BamB
MAARGTPAVSDSLVFVRTPAHGLAAFDLATGARRWTTRVGATPGLVSGTQIAVSDRFVLTGDDDVEAFEVGGGRRVWRSSGDAGVAAALGIYLGDISGGLLFTGSSSGRLFGIDVATGVVAWSLPVSTDGRTTVFAPAVEHDDVAGTYTSFTSPAAGGVVMLDRRGRLRWQTTLHGMVQASVGVIGTPVLAGSFVLASTRDGAIHALDRATGVLRWSLPPLRRDGEDFRPLIVARQTLVAGSLSGEIVAYDLATRRERWRTWPMETSVAFGLTADGDDVYVPYLSGHMVALRLEDGRERWRTGGRADGFRWKPVVRGAHVLAGGAGAGLVAWFRRDE